MKTAHVTVIYREVDCTDWSYNYYRTEWFFTEEKADIYYRWRYVWYWEQWLIKWNNYDYLVESFSHKNDILGAPLILDSIKKLKEELDVCYKFVYVNF